METDSGGRIFVKIFWLWLSFAAVVTIMCGLVYLLVQQDIRQSANYPQSQIAEDVTSSVGSGGSSLVDISRSLAPFFTIFDATGNVVQSNAVLNGSTPVPPHGVFSYAQAQANGEDRFTWQPQADVRVAAVLVYHPGNTGGATSTSAGFFVLSGRSLRDVEILESRLAGDTFFAWLSGLVVMFILSIFVAKTFSRKKLNENEKPASPQGAVISPPARVIQPIITRPIPPLPVTPVKVVPPIRVPTPIMPPAQMKPPSVIVPPIKLAVPVAPIGYISSTLPTPSVSHISQNPPKNNPPVNNNPQINKPL